MATETALQQEGIEEANSVWGGGKSPFNVSYGKIMMWYLIISDTFSFASLLIAYAALRMSSDFWPDPNMIFNAFPGIEGIKVPLGFVTLMTFILIMSSVFVVRAVQEGHKMNQKGVLAWLFLGIVGGVAFLACQAWEWSHLIHQGLTMSTNPFGYLVDAAGNVGDKVVMVFENGHDGKLVSPIAGTTAVEGPPIFGNLFFGITGFHGFHVFSGVLINIIVWIQAARGVYQRRGHYEMVEKVGLYWHFVDLVWVFVFLAFYLL